MLRYWASCTVPCPHEANNGFQERTASLLISAELSSSKHTTSAKARMSTTVGNTQVSIHKLTHRKTNQSPGCKAEPFDCWSWTKENCHGSFQRDHASSFSPTSQYLDLNHTGNGLECMTYFPMMYLIGSGPQT
eukprot:TRINITY_DN36995_c0_g1_i2.p2 TRINITY_DN36995_c0_g1~~TRINITY_DN36995_c0_g1_i2.p2  ORF type:complete len:133 (+),score=8.93 TRINITY_DN36995_c0_g1_i2:30-428(+)